jgi:nicotinamide mononucleotide transporter
MQIWEIIAVIFGVFYLLLAMRENRWCWVTGFISTAIFAALFFVSHLYMESLLQVYYVVMACYDSIGSPNLFLTRIVTDSSRWQSN